MNRFLFILMVGFMSALPLSAAETKPLPSVFIRLDDIQGLFGGQSLVVVTDGHLYARKAQFQKAGGRSESRFQLKLTDPQVDELRTLIRTCGIADYKEYKRYGVPDEARPRITITEPGLKRIEVEKWAGTKDARFDVLYKRLLEWVEKAAKTKPYREKDYDPRASFP
jgi:hypothetical protein